MPYLLCSISIYSLVSTVALQGTVLKLRCEIVLRGFRLRWCAVKHTIFALPGLRSCRSQGPRKCDAADSPSRECFAPPMLPFVNQTLATCPLGRACRVMGLLPALGLSPRSSLSTSSITYELYGVNDTLFQGTQQKIRKKIGGLKARLINELAVGEKIIRLWGPILAALGGGFWRL